MKILVLVKDKTLVGTYTNKKLVWEAIEKLDGKKHKLCIKTSLTAYTSADYQKLVSYIKKWTMVRLYKENKRTKVRNWKPTYRIWATNVNEEISK